MAAGSDTDVTLLHKSLPVNQSPLHYNLSVLVSQ